MIGRRSLLIIAAAVLVVLLASVGFLVYLNRLNANRVQEFKKSARDNWTNISKQADIVTASLAKVASTADLSDVSKAAGQMEKLIASIDRSHKKGPVPSGYGKLSEEQKAAIDALKSYLEEVGELASSADEKAFQENRGILENRSRKASSAVNKFLSNANFMRVNVSNDFYQVALAMETAWRPPINADDPEAQAVYDAANAFLSADIKESNFDKLWSLLSTRRIMALNQLQLPKEVVRSGWRQLWGDKTPVDYYLSRPSINFSNPETATIRAVVYLEGNSPKVESLRLVKEDGIWKVETYPSVGWN